MQAPPLADVDAARWRGSRRAARPAVRHPPLAAELGIDSLLVKHENHDLTGAFRIRGGCA